jgi:aryl-alcohol dehydrogenase-like predicted oxidoreductase
MSDLPTATLGRTGLEVTKLGYGAMELRGGERARRDVDAGTAGEILNAVLDAGINFIDTSPDYGVSEELIGEHISQRRDEYLLASKCGCPVNQPPPAEGQRPAHVFTPENIRAAVEQSLSRMRTDHLDLVQFHISPSRDTLEENGAVDALAELRDEGKTRFIGMSGTLPNLIDHIDMGVFDAFQIPYSALEREHEDAIRDAAVAGSGTIIRGGVARGAPSVDDETLASYPDFFRPMVEARRDRWEQADLDDLLDDMTRMEFMLRFTLSHPDMHTTIVGTANLQHLANNVAVAQKGPLAPDVYETAKQRLAAAT